MTASPFHTLTPVPSPLSMERGGLCENFIPFSLLKGEGLGMRVE
jgi:hypothetical protein